MDDYSSNTIKKLQKGNGNVIVTAANNFFQETNTHEVSINDQTDNTFSNIKKTLQNYSYELYKSIEPNTNLLDRYLNIKRKDINCELIEMLLSFDYEVLDKVLTKFEIPSPFSKNSEEEQPKTKSSHVVGDCGLCSFQLLVKIVIEECNRGLVKKHECPIVSVGVRYVVLKALEFDIEKLHKMECTCARCLNVVSGYNDLVSAVGIHENFHSVVL